MQGKHPLGMLMSDQALDEQLSEQLPRLRRFALRLTGDLSSADDLVQSTLLRMLSTSAAKRVEGDLRAWLFRILYRQFLDSRKSAKRYSWMLKALGREEPTYAPSVEREVIAESALAAFEQLTPDQRNLLLWVTVDGLSYKEIADMLEVPMGTVMSRLSRARQAMRRFGDGELPMPTLRILK